MTENEFGKVIVDCAFRVHQALGPGLLESVYEVILTHELKKAGLVVSRQVAVPLQYDGIQFDEGFRVDLVINDQVLVELKSVETILPVHKKQLLTYLRLMDRKLGYLINFNTNLFKQGITRIVNGATDWPPRP